MLVSHVPEVFQVAVARQHPALVLGQHHRVGGELEIVNETPAAGFVEVDFLQGQRAGAQGVGEVAL